MAKREMTGEEMIAFLEENGFRKVTEEDEKSALLKGSFEWPPCFKTPKRKPGRKKLVVEKERPKVSLKKAV